MRFQHMSQVIKAAAAVAVVAALPLAVSAGAATPGQFAQASPRGQPQGKAAQGQPPADNQGIDAQIADLRQRLHITPAQQTQFDALVQAMRQNAETMTKLAAQQPQGGKPNAVDATREGQRMAQAEADALGRMLPPLEALYGTLSEQQKRVADQLFASGPEQEERPAPKRR
jgi:periplasmic protein CpxP/Spy